MVMTVTVFWMDSNSTERISLSAVDFICHLLSIQTLNWIVPANGATPPHIRKNILITVNNTHKYIYIYIISTNFSVFNMEHVNAER